ncbi:dipeptide/oligopeptide/nickel ABC transporter permease/ATP-binding protein [Naasia lichenicola]|uniref:Dipeptide/oligopeptide/nickel ABC transporter permease/ATP-binding protein n=1 Tax=Naasia lichenicola TaxID=2565933 RepID=A0A4S4FJS7_9MICO|nr:dipeptide/oligopeptide/nickel ABC transporter permease/ATP-binding protein [Naasia lichenicola]THG29396.1 dipeptide/oligopeptide/nickel ABC transporter permease/ATP-binding protein [Naasia lichenicola]
MSESAMTSNPPVAAEVRAARSHLARRMLKNPTGLAAIIVLALIILLAILADVLAPMDPSVANINDVLAPPSALHPLGGDSAGRDVLSRLLFATRFSIAGALWAVLIAAVIGVTSGLIAGYYQKWFETVSVWIISVIQALPGIVVLLAARAVVGPSLWLIMAVFGLILSPAFYRLTYTAVVGVRNELFVDAARVAGVGDVSIIGRHILSVVRAPIIIQAALLAGIGIAVQAGLDFLGLGDAKLVTWGQMLSDAFSRMYQAPTLLIWPSLAMALTSVALVLFGNALRDELERAAGKPKRRRRGVAAVAPKVATEKPVTHAEAQGDARSTLLEVKDLVVGYDQPDGSLKQVVNGVSLMVRKGEVHGLIGESGSGKTQTAWSILRLLPAGGRIVAGSVVFDGKDLAGLSERDMVKLRGRRISYIPQEPMSNLDPSFTIGSQLVEPMVVTLGISKAEAKQRALDLLGRVGLPDPQKTFSSYPHEVSGGQAQRVLIAGAVSCEADLIIADEPTTALDVTVQAEILELLRDLQNDLGVSILIVTHNFGVVADLCDRVSVMQNGLIVETGPARAIFADPQHPYTKALFEAILEDGAARGPLAHSADRNTVTVRSTVTEKSAR